MRWKNNFFMKNETKKKCTAIINAFTHPAPSPAGNKPPSDMLSNESAWRVTCTGALVLVSTPCKMASMIAIRKQKKEEEVSPCGTSAYEAWHLLVEL